MKTLKKTFKKYRKLSHLSIRIIGKEGDFPSEQKDQRKFKLNNKSIVLNILFVPYKIEKIRLAYKLKYNFKRENQVIWLMITNDKK